MNIGYYTIILFIALFYNLVFGSLVDYFSAEDERFKFKSTIIANTLIASAILVFSNQLNILSSGLLMGTLIYQALDTYKNKYESVNTKDKLTYYFFGSIIFVSSVAYVYQLAIKNVNDFSQFK